MVQHTTSGNGMNVSYKKVSAMLLAILLSLSGWGFALYRDSVKAEILQNADQKYVSRELFDQKSLTIEQRIKLIEDQLGNINDKLDKLLLMRQR